MLLTNLRFRRDEYVRSMYSFTLRTTLNVPQRRWSRCLCVRTRHFRCITWLSAPVYYQYRLSISTCLYCRHLRQSLCWIVWFQRSLQRSKSSTYLLL